MLINLIYFKAYVQIALRLYEAKWIIACMFE